jgi:hypothetical protein
MPYAPQGVKGTYDDERTCTILSCAAYIAVHYFLTLSHKGYNFWENVFEHKMCVLISSTTSYFSFQEELSEV